MPADRFSLVPLCCRSVALNMLACCCLLSQVAFLLNSLHAKICDVKASDSWNGRDGWVEFKCIAQVLTGALCCCSPCCCLADRLRVRTRGADDSSEPV